MADFGGCAPCEKSATFCSASRQGATRSMSGERELFGKAATYSHTLNNRLYCVKYNKFYGGYRSFDAADQGSLIV